MSGFMGGSRLFNHQKQKKKPTIIATNVEIPGGGGALTQTGPFDSYTIYNHRLTINQRQDRRFPRQA